jgi:transglutaminase-like putative cysteine protease
MSSSGDTAMNLVRVRHLTRYSYASAVPIDRHEMLVLPRNGQNQRTVAARLVVPEGASLTRTHDAFGNFLCAADDIPNTDRLEFLSEFAVLHRPRTVVQIREASLCAWRTPIPHAQVDAVANASVRTRPDPGGIVHSWASSRAGNDVARNPFSAVLALSRAAHEEIAYGGRTELGTQDPALTLRRESGTCRDYAMLFVEAARSLGIPARFASGHLYDDHLDEGHPSLGGRSTHAWAQAWIPGEGWVDVCPTNDYVGGRNLVTCAVGNDATDVGVIWGSFFGNASDYLGMEVDVTLSRSPAAARTRFPSGRPGQVAEATAEAGAFAR